MLQAAANDALTGGGKRQRFSIGDYMAAQLGTTHHGLGGRPGSSTDIVDLGADRDSYGDAYHIGIKAGTGWGYSSWVDVKSMDDKVKLLV